MTNAIVKENKISFKTLEQKIFEEACKLARERTKKILEDYDDVLSKDRDASKYRNKGKRKTSIKTVYGDVEYIRQDWLMERRYMCIFWTGIWEWRR